MHELKYWQDKIKEKRKNTKFIDFLKNVASWSPIVLHKEKGLISRYPDIGKIKGILSVKEFQENRDNLYFSDYDLGKSFFVNFSDFQKNSYLPSRITFDPGENTDFSDIVLGSKNVYLSYVTINNCENILYSMSVKDNCTNILNGCMVFDNSENCHSVFGIIHSYKVFYSKYINNSNNIWFSSNLIGCSECVLCDNLDNASYYINNKKYEKQEYFLEKERILKDKYSYMVKYNAVEKIGVNQNSENVSGNYLVQCENINNAYNCYGVKNGNNLILIGGESGNENIYDVFQAGSPSGDDMYGVCGAGSGVQNLFNSCNVNGGISIFYSLYMQNSSYCIGCIGLINKEYCILNKQYSKEDWYIMADKIFSQMEQDGTIGDSFPGNINPFYFNDTMAKVLGGFKKEEVMKDGYMWREEEIKVDIPEGSDVISTSEINDYQGFDDKGEWIIDKKILKKIIKDNKGDYYRIVQMEYDFLMKHGLPIPEIHWMERIKLNFGV